MRPGRAFRPGTVAIGVQAIYDRRDVAFLLTWHNITAETGGTNAPDVAVPAREEPVTFVAPAGEATPAEPAAAAEPAPAALDVFGQAAADAAPAPGRPPGSDEFSDAVAIQVPIELREGVEKPYFLFGDPQYPVELWFVDLAEGAAELYQGRGADALAPSDAPAPEVLSGYADGEWAVVFKRPRSPARGVRFEEESFVPIAFSVWDGFYRERGAKRGLTRWFHVYVEPMAARSVVGPMAKAGLTVLGLELLVIALVRWRYRRTD